MTRDEIIALSVDGLEEKFQKMLRYNREFCSSRDYAYLIEDEIAKRDRIGTYIREIEGLVKLDGGWHNRIEWEWLLLTAPPELKCRAALLALEGK